MRPFPRLAATALLAALSVAPLAPAARAQDTELLPPTPIIRKFPRHPCPLPFDITFTAIGPSATVHFHTASVNHLVDPSDPLGPTRWTRLALDNISVVDDEVYDLFYFLFQGFEEGACPNAPSAGTFDFRLAAGAAALFGRPQPLIETFTTDPAARGWDLSQNAYWDTGRTAGNDPRTGSTVLGPDPGALGLGADAPPNLLTDEARTSITVQGLEAGRLYHISGWWLLGEFSEDNDITLTVSVTSASSNLVGNGSFESNADGWIGTKHATIAVVDGGQSGSRAVQVAGPLHGGMAFGIDDLPGWVTDAGPAGSAYEISAYVRSAASTNGVELQIREYVGGRPAGPAASSPRTALTTGWQKIGFEYVTRSAGAALDLKLMSVGAPLGRAGAAGVMAADAPDTFLVDNVVIRKLEPAAQAGASLDASTPGEAADAGGPLALPRSVYLAPPSPTPFGDETILAYGLPTATPVRIEVFDAAGRRIRTLVDGLEAAGHRRVGWSGTDDRNVPVGAGVYLIRLAAGEAIRVQRAVRRR